MQTSAYQKLTLQTFATSVYKVECELCNHVFAFSCTSLLQSGGSTNQQIDLAKLRQVSEESLRLQTEDHRNSLLKLDYSIVPDVRCPQCNYLQSWMINAGKYARAQRLAVIPLLPLLIAGVILISDFGFIAVIISILAMAVVIAFLWFLLTRLIFNKLNYNPNEGRKASTIKLPVVKMKIDKPAERVSGDVVNKSVKMISLEDFDAEMYGLVLKLTVDNA